MSKVRYLIAASVISMAVLTGCATHTRTVRTETVQRGPDDRYAVERETTVTETTKRDSEGGVVSGTVDTVGEVLSLPFRLVGGAIRALF